jgi:hypothetical protein
MAKGDGAGIPVDAWNELVDAFKTISEIFVRIAKEQKKLNEAEDGSVTIKISGAGNGK